MLYSLIRNWLCQLAAADVVPLERLENSTQRSANTTSDVTQEVDLSTHQASPLSPPIEDDPSTYQSSPEDAPSTYQSSPEDADPSSSSQTQPGVRRLLIDDETESATSSESEEQNAETKLSCGVLTTIAEGCGHTIHPQTSIVYDYPLCPPCRLERQILLLRARQDEIADHGGWMEWKEAAFKRPFAANSGRYKQATTGFGGKSSRGLDKTGWRNHKVQLLECVRQYELWMEAEEQWDEDHADQDSCEEIRVHGNSAGAALETWGPEMSSGVLDEVQDAAARYVHKRARDEEDSLAELWGDQAHGTAPSVPQQNDAVEVEALPKRKRRCVGGISFSSEVCVRTESDIDELRTSTSFNANPHKDSQPARSVLRTSSKKLATRSLPGPQLPKLKLPHSIMSLEDMPSRRAGRWQRGKNDRPPPAAYRAGKWAKGAGVEVVNTSFSSSQKDFDDTWGEMERYHQDLEIEAMEWDVLDRW